MVLVATMTCTGYGITTLASTVQVNASSEITENESIIENLITDNSASKQEVKMPKVVKEIKSERTKNTNTYLLSDGTKKLEIFAEDIRYKENGKWKNYNAEITDVNEDDKTLLEEMDVDGEAYIYTNTQGKYKHYFAETVNEENPVIMTDDNYEIKFAPVKEEKTVAKENNTAKTNIESKDILPEETSENAEIEQAENSADILSVEEIDEEKPLELTYSNESKSIEYEYISLTNGVKESIILNEKPESNVFEFKLELGGLEAKVNKDTNRIDLIDKNTKKLKANIEAPNIIDKSGMADYDHVHYELKTNEGGGYLLSVIVGKEYINNAEYPIKIDPTYTWINDSMIEYGATMSVGGAASSVLNKANNITLINSSSTKGRLYIKFEGLNEQLRGKYVYYSYFAAYTANTAIPIYVGAYRVLGDWDENTLTWNTQPEISNVYYDEETSFTSDGINTYTLTQWAKEIASGEINDDYGIALSCIGTELEGKYVNMYPLFTTGKLATFYVHYTDAEEVNSEYDGSFQVESDITDENKVELSWDKFSDDVCEYNIYVRTANKFNLIGRTTELEYTVDESYLGDCTDIRVMAIEQLTNLNFYGAKNYLSQIISVEKFESTDTDEEDNEVTERIYEQNHFDTDGDGLEDGYEIWDLGTKWNEEVVSESTENTEENSAEDTENSEKQYVLDSDDDGFNDDYEVFILGTNPAVVNTEGADSDGDSLSDASELIKGTDPHLVDSDFDGTNDNGESKADARYTENSTSELKALNAEAYTGLYDFELTETEDGATITRLVNVYSGMEKKVSYNYGNTSLNKEKLYFYDENQNNTAVIEKINTYDTEDTSENEKNVICITYAYDDNGNNILICDQKTRYIMTYDEDGEMTEIKVGEISLMKYSSQVLQNNATSEGDTTNIAVGGVIGSKEKIEEYGNGQKVRTVTTTYKIEDETEEEEVTEEETTQTEETQTDETEATEDRVVATKTEMFYNEDTQASYAAEYDAEGELIRFTDYTNGSDTQVVYSYTTGENGTTVSRSDGFIKTVTSTEDETNSISTDTTVYTFKDIKGTNRTYIQSLTADASDDSDINMDSVMYSGDKSEYIFEYDNDITSKKIYQGQSDTVKLSMVETHNSATNATYAITDADGSRTLGYTYDLAGNITEIREGSTVKTRYVYDGHGRLLKETDFAENVEHEYVYNSTGNIKAHKVYAIDENGTVATEAVQEIYCTHGNTNWPDRLTKYNGQSLTYDNSGNPLTYRDGLTFTWTRGRMLGNVKLNGTDVASYKYNSDGLRTYKDTASSTTVYEWDGTNLIRETVTYKSNNNVFDMWYLYGGNGEIDGFVYEYLNTEGNVESQTVYYEKNIQGDVIALLNADGERIAEYSYDAWGNVTESTCEVGYELPYSLNRIGYRGYYRDTETGFYYLQSRYYDAVVCRFINADNVNVLQNSFDDMFKDNLYIYCNSNPINAVDYSGQWYYTFSDYDEFLKKKKKSQYYGDTSYIKALAFRQTHHSALISNIKKYTKREGNLNDYINGQMLEPYNNMIYGTSTIGKAGCEVIATYNLMKLIGKYKYFPMLIAEFNLNNMEWLGGTWGTRPESLSRYFDAHKVKYVKYSTKKKFKNRKKNSDYYIVSYWNENAPFGGIHTVTVKKNAYNYSVYNFEMEPQNPRTVTIGTIKELYEGSGKQYSCIYGFDKQ